MVTRFLFLLAFLVPVPVFAETLLSESGGLSGALRAAMANNPSIIGKTAEVRAQGYTVDATRAARLPALSVSANNINEEFDDQGTVRINQPIYAFGKINRSIRVAEAGYSVEQWDLLRVQRDLIRQTAVAYTRIGGVLERARVAEQNIEEHERLYERIERRQQGQLASEADAVLANSRLIQSRALRDQLAGELAVAEAELRALTLEAVGAHVPVPANLVEMPEAAVLRSRALTASADMGLARMRTAEVRETLAREKVDALPTVFLRAEHDFLDQRFNQDPTRVGVALEANVDGMGFATRGRIRSVAERLTAAEQQLAVTREDVRRQVDILIANRDTQGQLIEAQQRAIDAVERTLESFVRQYETGRKSWVDVLNTQRELTNLRVEMVNFETNRLGFSLELQALTGGLDVLADIEQP